MISDLFFFECTLSVFKSLLFELKEKITQMRQTNFCDKDRWFNMAFTR